MTETGVPPQLAELTEGVARALLRGDVTVIKPGETLIIRVADWTPNQVREYQDVLDWWRESGGLPFRAVVVHGDELAIAEPETAQ